MQDFRSCFVPSPSPEVSVAIYRIADIMAGAPMDATGNRLMGREVIVKELVGKRIATATARNAIGWAEERDFAASVPPR